MCKDYTVLKWTSRKYYTKVYKRVESIEEIPKLKLCMVIREES